MKNDTAVIMSSQGSWYLDDIFKQLLKKKPRHRQLVLDTLATGFFQTAKDYTEVRGAVKFLKLYLGKNKLEVAFRTKCHIYVPGDGRDPQCGFVLAKLFTRSVVWSIDPRLRDQFIDRTENMWKRRLAPNQKIVKGKIEDFSVPDNEVELSIIVCVHNHGPITDLYMAATQNSKRVIVVSLPCCAKESNLLYPPTKEKTDMDILSQKRKLYLWDSAFLS